MDPDIFYEGQEILCITNKLPLGSYIYGIIIGETDKDVLIAYGSPEYYLVTGSYMIFPYNEDRKYEKYIEGIDI